MENFKDSRVHASGCPRLQTLLSVVGKRRSLIAAISPLGANSTNGEINKEGDAKNGGFPTWRTVMLPFAVAGAIVGAVAVGAAAARQHLRRTGSLLLMLTGASLACGCAGAVHQLPQVSSNELSMAQVEVKSTGGVPQRHAVADDEVKDTMRSALRRIRPSAEQVCREMHTGVCQWDFRMSANRSMNAGAGQNGLIVINRGIVEYAENEEEVAMVIAHEIGHQAANHPANNQRNQTVGRVAGAVLLGVVGAMASRGTRDNGAIARAAMNVGADVGGAIGGIAYSKEQEREADYLSAVILYRSGVDLDKARGFLVKLAKASGRTETGLLDTHPAGPERIAAWDRAVQEIRAVNGALPQRK